MMPTQAYCEIDFPHPSQPGRLAGVFSAPECILAASTLRDVPELLDRAEGYARSGHWVIGFVAYEAAPAFDRALQARSEPPAGMPFALFAVFRNRATSPRVRTEHLYGAWRDETPRQDFDTAIARIRHGISEGEYYQVNYTTRTRSPFQGDGLSFFDRLRASQPAGYCAYIDFGRWQICSVSPELFFHWGPDADGVAGRTLSCRPMKGTARRNDDHDADAAAAQALRLSPKERAENLMIVDLMRNDLSRVARPGSVDVPELFSVEAWPTVWQMTSTVVCRTQEGTALRDVFRALFPCGSITGAPKAAATAAIHQLETSARGVYCGAVGALMPGGEAMFSVGIRTPVINFDATLHQEGENIPSGVAECGIGSGVTLDSEAEREYAECLAKQAFLRNACPEYELLETLRLHQGRYWLLGAHMKRLTGSALALGFPVSERLITEALGATARRHAVGQYRVRLRLAANGHATAEAQPLEALPATRRIAQASVPVASGNPWLRHKTTRRELYARLASQQRGIFDTLLFNERGEATEFTRGNLVVELEGRLLTPPVACGLLPGVFREVLLARKRIGEGIVTIQDLADAKNIWFINSVRGALAVQWPRARAGAG